MFSFIINLPIFNKKKSAFDSKTAYAQMSEMQPPSSGSSSPAACTNELN